jgi:amino acid permease
MLPDGFAPNILLLIFLAAAMAVPMWILLQSMAQTRGMFGRAYGDVLADLMGEGARRSELLVRLVEVREARIARLERRTESGR